MVLVQVLNQTSVWWFGNTKHITDNAIVSAPDPNVTIAKKCTVFPVEFVGNTILLAPFCIPWFNSHQINGSLFLGSCFCPFSILQEETQHAEGFLPCLETLQRKNPTPARGCSRKTLINHKSMKRSE